MAAFENPIGVTSFESNVDASATPFRCVKLSSGKVVYAGVADVAIGLLQNKPAVGATATVLFSGISRGVASAPILENAKVAPAANGTIRTAVSGDTPIGIALVAAAGANEIIPVLVGPLGGTPLP
jgi:hypothetical protein